MCTQEWISLFLFGFFMNASAGADPIQIPNSAITVTTNDSAAFAADKVNDGVVQNATKQWGSGDCDCCSALHRPSWVQLTLDKIYLVERVIVFGPVDELARFTFASIDLSVGLREEFLSNEQFTSKKWMIMEKQLTPPRAIQIVRVTGSNSDGGYMMLCEIQIYRQAACDQDHFGKNCSPCHCLHGSSCDRTTGYCFGDQCAPGWTHRDCSVACAPGMFGMNCSSSCHCLNGASCDHVSGDCPDDRCAPGWTQSNCSVAEECHSEKYYNALLAVSTAFGVVVEAVAVFIVVFSRRIHRQCVGGTRANIESPSHNTYDDLAQRSMNPSHYDSLPMSTIGQQGR